MPNPAPVAAQQVHAADGLDRWVVKYITIPRPPLMLGRWAAIHGKEPTSTTAGRTKTPCPWWGGLTSIVAYFGVGQLSNPVPRRTPCFRAILHQLDLTEQT